MMEIWKEVFEWEEKKQAAQLRSAELEKERERYTPLLTHTKKNYQHSQSQLFQLVSHNCKRKVLLFVFSSGDYSVIKIHHFIDNIALNKLNNNFCWPNRLESSRTPAPLHWAIHFDILF